MRRVLQQDPSGCGLACVSMLRNVSYSKVKKVALTLPNFDASSTFYTEAKDLRVLLRHLGVSCAKRLVSFSSWERLPECCILAVSFREADWTWHWVVFRRNGADAYVLDPRPSVKANRRRDFGRLRPRWYLKVEVESSRN